MSDPTQPPRLPLRSVPEEDAWARTLGIEMLEVTPRRVLARLEAGPRHHQPMGVLHGGVYCSIVEAVASYGAGVSVMERGGVGVLGTANATDFFRSHAQGELRAEGVPIHQGRSQEVWEVRITRPDGKLVARGQVRFHVLQQLPSERRAAS